MKRIRVVHILDSLGVGGLEKGVTTLACNASEDIEHVILCLRTSGPLARKLPASVRVVEMKKPEGNSIRFLYRLAAEIRRQSPDVVHTRNWGGVDGILAALAGGVRNIVHGEHGWDLVDSHGTSRKRRLVRRFLSLGISEFTCVSQGMKSWLENEVRVFRPVKQIYNGVDTGLFTPDGDQELLHRELGLDRQAQITGIVARLDPIKDHRTLLKAFSLVAARNPQAHLVIIGDGPERKELQTLAGERVHFIGNRDDVIDLLRCLDVFVLSSLNEGISNTILEAMASGVPVVASNVGGNPELVRDGIDGLLFPAGNVEALASCLNTYLNDVTIRQEHGKNGRERALEQFSVQAMVAQYEEVWRRVAR